MLESFLLAVKIGLDTVVDLLLRLEGHLDDSLHIGLLAVHEFAQLIFDGLGQSLLLGL